MTEDEKIDFLVNSIKGDINRMCETNDLSEFDAMRDRAKQSLDMLSKILGKKIQDFNREDDSPRFKYM